MLETLKGIGHETGKITTVKEALAENGMDWEVEVRPTYFKLTDGTMSKMPSSFATVRCDTETMLGRVGGNYRPLSNEKSLRHVDALVASGAATLDSVFELRGGRQIGASLRLNERISIGGEDPMDLYIVVTTSHDSARANRTEITPVRLWCTNQLALISRTARQSWSVRHLSTMEANLKLVEEELSLVASYTEWLKGVGDSLIKLKIEPQKFKPLLVEALWFIGNEKRKNQVVEDILDVFEYSDLIGDDYRRTGWGALNAATEYFDHHRRYRNPHTRYNSITRGTGARVRNVVAQELLAIA